MSPDPQSGAKQENRWVVSYTAFIIRFRWLVIALTLLLVGISAYGARYVRVDSDTRIFFSPNSPELRAFDAVEKTYGRGDYVLIVVAPRDHNVFTKPALSLVADLTDESWRIPYAVNVNSLTNFQYSYAQGDEVVVRNLVDNPHDLSDADLADVRKRALSEPEIVNRLISSGGDATAIAVKVVLPEKSTTEVPRVTDFVRKFVAAAARDHPDTQIRLTGGLFADQALADESASDTRFLLPLMTFLVIACLWIGLRSTYSVLATMAVVVLSVMVAVGWAGWNGMVLNGVTAGAPILTMTLAIADCVHLLAGIGHLRQKGYCQKEAIIESMRVNWTAVLMTSVTTAAAFVALNFADSPPINDMGNIVAVGVSAAWFITITFFVALLSILPAPRKLPILSDPELMTRLARGVITHRKRILIIFGTALVVIAAGIPMIRLNDDIVRYFPKDSAFRTATEFVEQKLGGFHELDYSIPAKDSVTDPKYLATLEAFADWFRQQPHVKHVDSLVDLLKRLNRDMHGGDPAFYAIPDSSNLAAQYLLFYEMSLPAGAGLNDIINISKTSSLFSVGLNEVTSADIRSLASRGDQWLADRGIQSHATGLSVLYSHLTERNIRSMVVGVIVELIAISFLMILILRSFRIGMISLVPNLVPAMLAFGVWGWTVHQVNLAVAAVASMTFGVVVDDTIHSLVKYMRARRQLKLAPLQAVEYTFVAAGDPMILTGVTLILGFGVLSFSGFAVTQQMGLLSSLTLLLGVVADLLLLPPLLILLDRGERAP